MRGAALAKEAGVDLIVGVGGGSVMDMAKLIKAFYCSRNNEAKLAAGLDKVIDPNIPILPYQLQLDLGVRLHTLRLFI